jgi:LPXTG-site transpeptidase (sortase) family protein
MGSEAEAGDEVEAAVTAEVGADGVDGLSAAEVAARIRPLPTAKDLPAEAAGPIPVTISFPSIGVDGSPVDPVGIEPNGEMEVPPARRVGWYQYGARPGQAGSTVLAAHIAADGVDGVFRHLADVEVGDRFEVTMDDGTTVAYEIVELAQYDKTELPFDRVFARDGDSTVTLVTCGGSFQPSERSYQDNVVAYAAPIGS